MCIVFWTLEHPDYALMMCTNRDEYLTRPTSDAHFHNFDHDSSGERGATSGQILSGIDLRGGGTWLGLNRSGRLAVLTNITEPYQTFESTRGTLVSSFLLSDSSSPLEDEVGKIIPRDAQFAGFNLLLLAPQSPINPLHFEASFVSNNGAGGILHIRSLDGDERTCGGFSNGIDAHGGGDWPKVKRGKEIFASIIDGAPLNEGALTAQLFQLLTEHSPEPVEQREDLRRTIQVLPFSIPSTLPEADKVYGTRLSTVILVRRDGSVLFIERDLWKSVDGRVTKTDPPSERIYRFQLEL
ncbi:DUF833-domain-containing protein [Hymenopellis radicata]|nr:DUF833-domain-containing protein [Hymenopellis radicata]